MEGGYILSVWRELDGFDWLLEVEVVQHSTSLEVDQEGTAVYVRRYQ